MESVDIINIILNFSEDVFLFTDLESINTTVIREVKCFPQYHNTVETNIYMVSTQT